MRLVLLSLVLAALPEFPEPKAQPGSERRVRPVRQVQPESGHKVLPALAEPLVLRVLEFKATRAFLVSRDRLAQRVPKDNKA